MDTKERILFIYYYRYIIILNQFDTKLEYMSKIRSRSYVLTK